MWAADIITSGSGDFCTEPVAVRMSIAPFGGLEKSANRFNQRLLFTISKI